MEYYIIIAGGGPAGFITALARDRRPWTLPGAAQLKVKLVFADRGGTLLEGQIYGGPSVDELINAVAIGIQSKINFRELDMMQIAIHPLNRKDHKNTSPLSIVS